MELSPFALRAYGYPATTEESSEAGAPAKPSAIDPYQKQEIDHIFEGMKLLLLTLEKESIDVKNIKKYIFKLQRDTFYSENNSKNYMSKCIAACQSYLSQYTKSISSNLKITKFWGRVISSFGSFACRERRTVMPLLTEIKSDGFKLKRFKDSETLLFREGFDLYQELTELKDTDWYKNLKSLEQIYFCQLYTEFASAKCIIDDDFVSDENILAILRGRAPFPSTFTKSIIPHQALIEGYSEQDRAESIFALVYGPLPTSGKVPTGRIGLVTQGLTREDAKVKLRVYLLLYMRSVIESKVIAAQSQPDTDGGSAKIAISINLSACSYLDFYQDFSFFPKDTVYEELLNELLSDDKLHKKVIAAVTTEKQISLKITNSLHSYPINITRKLMELRGFERHKEQCECFLELYASIDTSEHLLSKKIAEYLGLYKDLVEDVYSEENRGKVSGGKLLKEGDHNKQAILAVLHQLIIYLQNEPCIRNCKSSKDRTGLVEVLLRVTIDCFKRFDNLPKFIYEAMPAAKLAGIDLSWWDSKPPRVLNQKMYNKKVNEYIARAKDNYDDKTKLNTLYELASRNLSPEDYNAMVLCVEYKIQAENIVGHPLKDTCEENKYIKAGMVAAGTIGTFAVAGFAAADAVHDNNSKPKDSQGSTLIIAAHIFFKALAERSPSLVAESKGSNMVQTPKFMQDIINSRWGEIICTVPEWFPGTRMDYLRWAANKNKHKIPNVVRDLAESTSQAGSSENVECDRLFYTTKVRPDYSRSKGLSDVKANLGDSPMAHLNSRSRAVSVGTTGNENYRKTQGSFEYARKKLATLRDAASDGGSKIFIAEKGDSSKHKERISKVKPILKLIDAVLDTSDGNKIEARPALYNATYINSSGIIKDVLREVMGVFLFAGKEKTKSIVLKACGILLSIFPYQDQTQTQTQTQTKHITQLVNISNAILQLNYPGSIMPISLENKYLDLTKYLARIVYGDAICINEEKLAKIEGLLDAAEPDIFLIDIALIDLIQEIEQKNSQVFFAPASAAGGGATKTASR